MTTEPTRSSPPEGVRACTCKRPTESDGSRPGRRLASGFDWHAPNCPVVAGAVLSSEARARIQRKFEEFDEAQRRAMEGARTYVIG